MTTQLRSPLTPLLALFCATVAAGQPTALSISVDANVTRALPVFHTPGAAIVVVRDGRVLLANGYGVQRLGTTRPVDAHTRFQIASNSKAFTTAALAILVDEGKLHWDDRVIDHLPGFQLSDPYVTRELTVRDLVTHRSGLGLGAGDLLWLGSHYSRDDVLHRIRFAKVASSFRSRYAYDNVLYAAAGEVIRAITGQAWEQFVQHRILAPIGMTETAPTFAQLGETTLDHQNIATPHSMLDGTLRVVSADTIDVVAPAGAILSNVTDMAKWMTLQLDSGQIRGRTPRLWSTAQARELWTAQTVLPIDEMTGALHAFQPQFSAYGLGWFLRDYRGHKLVTHTGGVAGMTSRVLLVPDQKLGIAVLTNGESSLSTAIAWSILDQVLGAPTTDWITHFATRAATQRTRADSTARAARSARDTASRPSLPATRYVATYLDSMYGTATITQERGSGTEGLVLRFTHSPPFVADLTHWQYDTFVARWRDRHIPDAYVTFTLTPEGRVAQFTMRPVSPLADFSYDYQDLTFRPIRAPAGDARP